MTARLGDVSWGVEHLDDEAAILSPDRVKLENDPCSLLVVCLETIPLELLDEKTIK
ncbi:MAG: hypothetical protein ACFFD4_02075 [Candidatus Odinarchaeota archaeon]